METFALVTGASDRIGKAFALALAPSEAGCRILDDDAYKRDFLRQSILEVLPDFQFYR